MQPAHVLTHVPCRHREEAVTKMIQAFPLETVIGRGRAVHPCDVPVVGVGCSRRDDRLGFVPEATEMVPRTESPSSSLLSQPHVP